MNEEKLKKLEGSVEERFLRSAMDGVQDVLDRSASVPYVGEQFMLAMEWLIRDDVFKSPNRQAPGAAYPGELLEAVQELVRLAKRRVEKSAQIREQIVGAWGDTAPSEAVRTALHRVEVTGDRAELFQVIPSLPAGNERNALKQFEELTGERQLEVLPLIMRMVFP